MSAFQARTNEKRVKIHPARISWQLLMTFLLMVGATNAFSYSGLIIGYGGSYPQAANLKADMEAKGVSVTMMLTSQLPNTDTAPYPDVDVPDEAEIVKYRMVWDISVDNANNISNELTPKKKRVYEAYLQAGGALFLMGENQSFLYRNSSIAAFVTQVGGGSVAVNGQTTTTDLVTVLSPFTGPDSLVSVFPTTSDQFAATACGLSATNGSGAFFATYSASGCGIVWNNNDLTRATNGTLLLVNDVDF